MIKNNSYLNETVHLKILSLLWNEVYITIDIVSPDRRSSSVSSDGGEGGAEDGEAKLTAYMRHRFTVGCSPFT